MAIQGPKGCFHTRKKNSLRCIRKRSTKGGTTARLLWETRYLLLPNFWRPSLIRIGVSFTHESCSLWAQLFGHIFILFFGHLSFKIWPKRWTPARLPCGHPQSLLFFPHSQSPSMTLSHHHGPLPHYSRYILLRYEGIQEVIAKNRASLYLQRVHPCQQLLTATKTLVKSLSLSLI